MANRIRNYIINATNVHVSVNGHWLDEAVSISAQRQSSHKMAYDYIRVDPRRPLKGHTLVVGTIGIHFRAVDYFFRYLTNTTGRPDTRRADAVEQLRAQLRQFKTNEEIMQYLSGFDLNSQEFTVLQEAIEKNSNNEPSDSYPWIESRSPDVVGDDGFRAGLNRVYRHPTLNQTFVGHTIRISYGDAVDEQVEEVIHGVTFNGLAKSPLENSAGASADPAMEYYSFIAARIDPPDSHLSSIPRV